MEFTGDQAIYIQISDKIRERILRKEWTAGMRIPSIRNIAMQMEVNPNTVMRSYTYLQERRIVLNKRGIGFFISDDAFQLTQTEMKERFMNVELPGLVKKMLLLDINPEELQQAWVNGKKEWDHVKK